MSSSGIEDSERLAALDRYDILDTAPEATYDDIVVLARQICETPVALVSFVAGDRQWFKAKAGSAACETPIEQAVCAYAVAARAMLVIPDLTQDERTRDNVLVTGAPHIRFYAGAPLETPDGFILGTLCVTDHKPRPQGLSPQQASALAALARQVVSQLELRRAIKDRDAHERRYSTIFEAIDSGFCIVEVKFDEALRPLDYRFLEVNPAFERQTGIVDAVGKWMREIAPAHEQHWFDIYGRVALTGKPERFENAAEALSRWYDVYAFRMGDPAAHLVCIRFNDISERRRAEVIVRESEERLQLALSAGDGIGTWDWDIPHDRVTADARFAELYGLDPLTAVKGATVDAFFCNVHPPDMPRLRTAIDEALKTGEPFAAEYRLVQPDGALRWVAAQGRCTSAPDGSPRRFSGVSFDISERKADDERRTALLRLGDALRDATSKADAIKMAAQILGETLRVSRAGYATVDVRGDSLLVQGDWTAGGARSVAGRHSSAAFSATVARLATGEMIVVSDSRQAGWSVAEAGAYAEIGVRAHIAVPLLRGNDLVGALFVHSDCPRDWTAPEIGFARTVADGIYAVIAKLEAEADQRLLNQEISHRLKNTLAMVQAIAMQTLKRVTERDAVEAFNQRIQALSTAHDVLLRQSWMGAAIRPTIESVLALHDDQSRFSLNGPDTNLGPKAVLSLSLLLHELATNAVKHGSLSIDSGTVAIKWDVKAGVDPTFDLLWEEHGGPRVKAPKHRGFGSRLIGAGLVGTGTAKLRYVETGVVAEFCAPLSLMTAV